MLRYFFVRLNGRYQKIPFDDIRYVEACKNYIRIVTGAKSYMVLVAMKQMERILPQNMFCRIHRSYIVSLNFINAFDHELVYLDGIDLPLGEHFLESLHSKVYIVANELRGQPSFSKVHIAPMLSVTG